MRRLGHDLDAVARGIADEHARRVPGVRAGAQLEAGRGEALDTDDKPGVASEGSLKGEKHAVTLEVTPLCDGKLGIRYTVTDV